MARVRYLVLQIPGKPYDNYRISPQSVNITGFPHNRESLQRPRNTRKHLLRKYVCKMFEIFFEILDCFSISFEPIKMQGTTFTLAFVKTRYFISMVISIHSIAELNTFFSME